MAAPRIEPKIGGPVALDPESITPDGAGYRAQFTGDLDTSWIRAYLTLWTGSSFFSRFHVDLASRSVWFPAPDGEGENDVALFLEIAGAILQVTSRLAVTNAQPRFEVLSPALRRNRLAPGAQLQLHLPVPPAPRPPVERPPVVWEDPIEDLVQEEIDSLVAEDLVEM
jgi:hypothetical protein